MPTSDDLRGFAEECQHMADVARDADTRQRWLQLAQEWLQMTDPDSLNPAAAPVRPDCGGSPS